MIRLNSFNDLSNSPEMLQMTPKECLAFEDITVNIFQQCCLQNDFTSFLALSCTNKNISATSKSLMVKIDFMKFYPNLTIWDAEKQQLSVGDEPDINKIKLIKIFEKLPSVEDNSGYTLLTMPKGTSLNSLVAVAKKHNIKITDNTYQDFFHFQGNVSVEKTYRIMIANGFLNSLDCGSSDEKNCNILPTIQELLASEIALTISGAKREIEHDTKKFYIVATSSIDSAPNSSATRKVYMMQGKGNALSIINGNPHTSNKIRACCKF